MRPIASLLLIALLAGCGDDNQARVRELDQSLAEKDAIIDRIQREGERDGGEHLRLLEALRGQIKESEREHARTIGASNRLVEEKNRRIAEAEAALKNERARVASLEAELARARASVAEAGAVRAAAGGDAFPVRVFGVTGRRVVTGTHTETRSVETGEVYRDEFGNKRRQVEQQDEEVNEYSYRVTFNVENPGDEPRTISARAGSVTRDFTVPPGVQTGLTVDSALGSALMVMLGGMNRSFPVTYESGGE